MIVEKLSFDSSEFPNMILTIVTNICMSYLNYLDLVHIINMILNIFLFL